MGIGTGNTLRELFRRGIEEMEAAVRDAPAEQLLSDPQGLTAELIARYELTPVVFNSSDVRHDGIRSTGSQMTTTLTAPMSGDVELLTWKASTTRPDLYHAEVHPGRVVIPIIVRSSAQAEFDAAITSLAEHVQWINNELPHLNTTMRDAVSRRVTEARSRLIAVQAATAGLTTPVAAPSAVEAVQRPGPSMLVKGMVKVYQVTRAVWHRLQGAGHWIATDLNRSGVIAVVVAIAAIVVAIAVVDGQGDGVPTPTVQPSSTVAVSPVLVSPSPTAVPA